MKEVDGDRSGLSGGVPGGARDEGRLFGFIPCGAIIRNEEQGGFGEVATARNVGR